MLKLSNDNNTFKSSKKQVENIDDKMNCVFDEDSDNDSSIDGKTNKSIQKRIQDISEKKGKYANHNAASSPRLRRRHLSESKISEETSKSWNLSIEQKRRRKESSEEKLDAEAKDSLKFSTSRPKQPKQPTNLLIEHKRENDESIQSDQAIAKVNNSESKPLASEVQKVPRKRKLETSNTTSTLSLHLKPITSGSSKQSAPIALGDRTSVAAIPKPIPRKLQPNSTLVSSKMKHEDFLNVSINNSADANESNDNLKAKNREWAKLILENKKNKSIIKENNDIKSILKKSLKNTKSVEGLLMSYNKKITKNKVHFDLGKNIEHEDNNPESNNYDSQGLATTAGQDTCEIEDKNRANKPKQFSDDYVLNLSLNELIAYFNAQSNVRSEEIQKGLKRLKGIEEVKKELKEKLKLKIKLLKIFITAETVIHKSKSVYHHYGDVDFRDKRRNYANQLNELKNTIQNFRKETGPDTENYCSETIDINIITFFKNTSLLHAAVFLYDTTAINNLLKLGAKLSIKSKDFGTVIDLATHLRDEANMRNNHRLKTCFQNVIRLLEQHQSH